MATSRCSLTVKLTSLCGERMLTLSELHNCFLSEDLRLRLKFVTEPKCSAFCYVLSLNIACFPSFPQEWKPANISCSPPFPSTHDSQCLLHNVHSLNARNTRNITMWPQRAYVQAPNKHLPVQVPLRVLIPGCSV